MDDHSILPVETRDEESSKSDTESDVEELGMETDVPQSSFYAIDASQFVALTQGRAAQVQFSTMQPLDSSDSPHTLANSMLCTSSKCVEYQLQQLKIGIAPICDTVAIPKHPS